jgi:hypothetical protein
MLTGRKLFTASNDLAVLKQIQACKIPPPSKFNPHIPKELDKIILKALSKDRNGRYEDMDKFNRALVKFLYQNYPDFNATDLNSFAEQLFEKEITEDRVKFVEYGKIDTAPFLSDLKRDAEGGGGSASSSTPVLGGQGSGSKKKIELDFGADDASPDGGLTLELGNKSSAGLKVAGVATTKRKISKPGTVKRTVSTRGASTTKNVKRSPTQTRKTKSTSTRSTNRRQTSKSGGTFKLGAIAAAMVVGFVYYQANLIKDLTGFSLPGTSDAVVETKKVKNVNIIDRIENEKAKYGIISFSNYEIDMDVLIDGKKVQLNGIEARVPLHKKLHITVRKAGYKKFEAEDIRLTGDVNEARVTIPELEEERIGLLSTSRNFTSGSRIVFFVDGQKVERDLPVDNYRVPAGSYEGVIANPLLGTERKIKFIIEENKKLFLE